MKKKKEFQKAIIKHQKQTSRSSYNHPSRDCLSNGHSAENMIGHGDKILKN